MLALILGSSGYIGGSILAAFRRKYPDLTLYAFTRSNKNSKHIEEAGGVPILGDYSDSDLLRKWCAKVDIVINAGESDNVSVLEVVLSGIKERYIETKGKRGVLIHTSGVAVFLDDSRAGTFDENGKVWNDNKEDDIKSISPSALHGAVDNKVLLEGCEEYVNTYIICPGAVVGRPLGPIKRGSFFIKAIIQLSLLYGHAIYVGEGTNQFTVVSLDDLIDLYSRIYDLSLSELGSSTSSYSRYFIADSSALGWNEISRNLGKVLYEIGKISQSEPQSKQIKDVPVPFNLFMGSNMRVAGERSRALGWLPKNVDLSETFPSDVPLALADLDG